MSRLKTILGQPSWKITSRTVTAYVTELGGHLGPATFTVKGRKIAPLSVAPWVEEKLDRSVPDVIRVLRGDFFCLPFGGNTTPYRGEHHPVHGETANAKWRLEELARGQLHLSLRTKARRGRVDKHISVRDGQNVVYERHIVSGMSGPMDFGHHAMVRFPDAPGSGVISTSPFVYGQVLPSWFERPEEGGYQSLKPGARFTSLRAVKLLTGATTDLSRYPARRGFDDLVMLVADPRLTLGWTAVTFPKERFVWFALRDPRVLRNTIFWITNGGRHMPPWNSRHVNIMGLEESTSYFHYGLAESAGKNPLNQRGYPTAVQLSPKRPLTVNYIFGVAAIPPGFAKVRTIISAKDGVRLVSSTGHSVSAAVDVAFLQER